MNEGSALLEVNDLKVMVNTVIPHSVVLVLLSRSEGKCRTICQTQSGAPSLLLPICKPKYSKFISVRSYIRGPKKRQYDIVELHHD